MNTSSSGDDILIHGYRHKKNIIYLEQNISIFERLYFKGIYGRPTIYCKNCGTIFHIERAGTVMFENIRFSEGLGRDTNEREKRETTAFKVDNTIVKIMNCHFENIPYAINFQGEGINKLVSYNNTFIRPVKAIQVQRVGYLLQLLIKDCQFIGESNVSGDAVIAKNSKQVHKMGRKLIVEVYNSTFTRLKSAIYVDASHINVTTVKLNGSKLVGNRIKSLARSHGGDKIERSSGITLADYTPLVRKTSKLIIRNSQFINNTSIYGGSLSLYCGRPIPIIIEKSTFTGNTAIMSGGAIQSTGKCEIILRSCSFISNSCTGDNPKLYSIRLYDLYGIGGALVLVAYENSPFDPFQEHPEAFISGCEFKNNAAQYSGGAIYTNTHIVNIERTMIESSQESRLHNVDSELIRCKYRCNLKNVSFVVGNVRDSRTAALFGESNVALRLDQSSMFICPKGSILMYSKLRSQERRWEIVSDTRSTRKNFMMFAFYCFNCPPDHYNLNPSILVNSTLNNHQCHKCPPGGACKAGILRSKSNYWGFKKTNSDRANFIQLPEGYGCKGSQCIDFDSCASGRTGTLCGTCGIGLTESMVSTACIQNDKCNLAAFWVLTCVLFFAYLVFFIFKREITSTLNLKHFKCQKDTNAPSSTPNFHQEEYQSIDNTSLTPRSEQRSVDNDVSNANGLNLSTAAIKISFYFFQAESLLKAFRYKDDRNTASNFARLLSSFFTFNFIQNKVVWTCGMYNANPIDKIQLRLGFVASIFLALASVYVILLIYNNGRAGDEERIRLKKGKLNLSTKIVVASFEIFLLNYSLFANIIFKLLRCVEINGELFLHIQGNIKCYEEWQYLLMALGSLWAGPFCIFVFVLPWLLFNNRIKKRGLLIGCIYPLPLLIYECFMLTKVCQGTKNNSNSIDDERQRGLEEREEGSEERKEGSEEREERDEEVQEENEGKKGSEGKEFDDAAVSEIFENRVGPFSTSAYQKLYFSWEGVYILRRLVLVMCASFIADPIYKLYAMLMAQLIFLLHHIHLKPYAAKSMNHLETVSLTVLVLINSMCLFPAYGYSYGIEEEEGKSLLLLKIFGWLQLIIGTILPMILHTIVVLFMIACFINLLIKFSISLLRTCCK